MRHWSSFLGLALVLLGSGCVSHWARANAFAERQQWSWAEFHYRRALDAKDYGTDTREQVEAKRAHAQTQVKERLRREREYRNIKAEQERRARATVELGSDGSAPISFTRLIVRVPSGANIGAHHAGLLEMPQYRHTWLSNTTVGSTEFNLVASEHMRSRGYRVLGGDSRLFGRDDSAKAEYMLGATVRSLAYNTYGRLSGDYSRSSLTIDWQLYDVFREEVVYSRTTTGNGRRSAIDTACILSAFRSCLDDVLNDPSFVDLVRKSPRKAWEEEADRLAPITVAICASEQTIRLPGDLNSVLDSVLTIRAGGSVGSGVVISDDGWAITAAHVVSKLEEVIARMHSGLEFTAKVVRVDSQQDVALIKLPGRGHVCVGVDLTPEIGMELFAVGAPAAIGEILPYSVAKGVVSGLRESQGKYYIQTDTAINHGNSGGPLLSSDGKVVGIVSSKIVSLDVEGLAFGVPVQAAADRLGISWR